MLDFILLTSVLTCINEHRPGSEASMTFEQDAVFSQEPYSLLTLCLYVGGLRALFQLAGTLCFTG